MLGRELLQRALWSPSCLMLLAWVGSEYRFYEWIREVPKVVVVRPKIVVG
jgi:hypothetical protein